MVDYMYFLSLNLIELFENYKNINEIKKYLINESYSEKFIY